MRVFGLVAMVLALGACGGAEQGKPASETQTAPASEVVASAPVAASVEVIPGKQTVINIHNLALQSEEAVAAMLGQPVAECEKGKYGLTCQYNNNGDLFEIVFINGKSDWITIQSTKFKSPLDVPEQLFLQHEPSTSMSKEQIVWQDAYGFKSMMVQVLPGNKVDFVYIKATTK